MTLNKCNMTQTQDLNKDLNLMSEKFLVIITKSINLAFLPFYLNLQKFFSLF